MKKLFLILTVFFSLIVAYGQAQITFQKTYGSIGEDWGTCIKQTSDGNYFITGVEDAVGFSNFDNCQAGKVSLLKLNSHGILQWNKTFTTNDLNIGHSLEVTSDDGIIIAGETGTMCPFIGGNSSTYVIKSDSFGTVQWTGTYASTYSATPTEIGYCVKQTNDGGYLVAGKRIGMNRTDNEAYIMKLNALGIFQWSKVYGESGNEAAYSIAPTADGGYIIGGLIDLYLGVQEDMYLIKTDSSGNMLWNKTYNATFAERVVSVIPTKDGGYILVGNIVGTQDDDILLLKVSSNGTVLWNKAYGGPLDDYATCLKQTKDGYIIAGYTYINGTNTDACLIKTDTAGNIQWSKTYGGTNYDEAKFVEPTIDNGYIIVGGTKSFGLGGRDIYVIKTDSLGNSNCNEPLSAIVQKIYTITSSSKGYDYSFYSTANLAYATTVGSGAIETSLCLRTGIEGLSSPIKHIDVFPNPFSTQVVIQANTFLNNATLTVCNCLGQTIKQLKNISGETVTFYRDDLPSGLYFLHITQDNKTLVTEKLVIVDN